MKLIDSVYYSETSETFLRWSDGVCGGAKDSVAGHICSTSGYAFITIKGDKYPIHDVVWILFNDKIPSGMIIDHINNIKSDNNISNLRLATHSQNNMNKVNRIDSTSGVKGLTWHKTEKRWYGSVTVDGKRFYKKSADRGIVEKWLYDKRQELHKEFCNHG